MFVLWMLLVGLGVGVAAGLFLHQRSFTGTILLGLLGSTVVTVLGRALEWFPGTVGAGAVGFSAAGAVLALAIYGLATRRLAGRRY
jgi:uncharacterized membrane protein YeaQ/YmgE (transglycosylase-associated protein family)